LDTIPDALGRNTPFSIRNSTCIDLSKDLFRRNKFYKKGRLDKDLQERLASNTDVAIIRSKKMAENNNPSTTVYKFLEKLIALKK